MKFTNALPYLALALGVVAEITPTLNEKATLVGRDLAAVSAVIAKINQQVSDLDTAIQGFSGSSGDLLSKSQALIATVKTGTGTIEGMPELSLTDAAQIASSVQTLQTAIDSVVSDIIAKKEAVVAAGAGPDVLKTLQAQKAGAEGLATAVASKVPEALRSTATTLSAGVATSLQKAITAYEGVGSGPSSGSGSSSRPGSSGGSSSGAPKPASAGGSSSGGSSSGSSSSGGSSSGANGVVTKPSTTSAGVKPAQYTGSAASNGLGSPVVALAAFVAAMAL
jgi:hypothetical protein